MHKNDKPTVLEQALLLICAAVVLLGGASAIRTIEHKNAPQAPAVTRNGSPSPSSQASSQPAALLSHPLNYAATIRQSGDGIDEPKLRYYIPKERQ